MKSHRPGIDHDEVVVIGDIHGNDLALISLILMTQRYWKKPFFLFLGGLSGTLGSSEAVLKLVISLQNLGVACVLQSKSEMTLMEKAFLKYPFRNLDLSVVLSFYHSFKKYLVYKHFFLSHAPVFKYPSPSWIKSQSLYDTYLTHFEQAVFAGYDFRGEEVVGRFKASELVNDPDYIGVCGHQRLGEVTLVANQYLCVDSSGSAHEKLSAYGLNSGKLFQVDRRGLALREYVVQAL